MKFGRQTLRWLSRIMLGMALFAQAVLAAEACATPFADPVQAFAAPEAHEDSCHEEAGGAGNANACLVHCTQSDQVSLDVYAVPPAPPSEVVLRLPALPDAPQGRGRDESAVAALNTGPPLNIQYCSYQI